MKREEITVQAKLKPNCGLENTRASLVMRRIAPLCDSATCHPHAIKSSRETIPYLRDHGLFVTFVSRTPERVLAAISGAFFVDSCTIVEDPEGIPPFEMPSAPQEDDAENGGIEAISSFADRDARSERDEKLSNLIAQLEETNRSLRAHAESLPNDRVLSDIAFSYAQTLDHLRSTVALSRIEAFDRIAPSLHKLVEDYGRQFGVPVDLELEQGRMDLDRSVLASIEETLRRALRSCIRDGIESAEERADLGKPERATIRLRLENEGSDVVCRIEHDGRPFDAHRIATIASKRGLLARPLDAYSDEEIGAFILLPQFFLPSAASDGNAFAELNEIGCMLQRIGGRGTMRNTERGTLEIVLRFPVPFTVFEAALLRTGGVRFAVPAQQIVRFEAFDPARVQRGGAAGEGSKATSTWYEDEHGAHIEMLNQGAKPFPLDAAHPAYTVLLEALGERYALAADDVEGYERISMLQLPARPPVHARTELHRIRHPARRFTLHRDKRTALSERRGEGQGNPCATVANVCTGLKRSSARTAKRLGGITRWSSPPMTETWPSRSHPSSKWSPPAACSPLPSCPSSSAACCSAATSWLPSSTREPPTLDRGTSCSSKGKDACWGCSSTARPTSSTSTKPNMPSWPSSAVRASRRERFPCWISTP